MPKSARELSIEELATAYGLSKEDVNGAISASSQDTLAWGKKESAKGLGDELDLPYPTIRKRMKLKVSSNRGQLWYGFNAVDLKFAKPTKSGDGIDAAGKHYSGAFQVESISNRIFKRNGRLGVISKGRYKGKTRERISKVSVPIVDEANSYLNAFVEKVRVYFIDRLIHHLSNLATYNSGKSIKLNYDHATIVIANQLAPRINT